ncbi:MAG: efflux RND transporter periplasmic adaptor subunit [Clostridiaceae bacterium]|nr:efflux RND transporter periplasmic adaptor subunit [Clostridiaceae bacterium]
MKIKFFKSVLFLLVTILLIGCSEGGTTADGDSISNHAIAVTVTEVERSSLESEANFNGTLEPLQEVNITPKMMGEIASIKVDLGRRVSKGDVLFTLDDRDIRMQLQQAKVGLETAEMALHITKGSSIEQQLAQLQSNLRSTKQSYDDAKTNYGRIKQLYESEAVSKQNLESVESAMKMAQEQYHLAKDSLTLAEEKTIEEGIRSAEMQVKQAQLAYDHAKTQVENATITSPITGTISSINIQVGELAGTAGPAMTIIDTSSVYVNMTVTESIINSLHVGDVAKVKVPAASSELFEGSIANIGLNRDDRLQGYPVKILVNNKEGLLKGGMSAEVILPLDQVLDSLVIPISSIVNENGQQIVYIVHEGRAERREVSLGISNEKFAQVLDGLEKGEKLIVQGQNFIHHGSEVMVTD